MNENDEIRRLIDTLLKVEALHAGAMTPGERDAAASAMDRVKRKLEQFIESDPPEERHCTFSNHWSKQLFCALAKRYGLQPYRYYRQRYTTVMLRVPGNSWTKCFGRNSSDSTTFWKNISMK